jgi:hypothetical protein
LARRAKYSRQLGELVANLLYIAEPGEYGAGAKFGKASLGFMVAWAINYL